MSDSQDIIQMSNHACNVAVPRDRSTDCPSMVGSDKAFTHYSKEQLSISPIAYRTILKHSKIKGI